MPERGLKGCVRTLYWVAGFLACSEGRKRMVEDNKPTECEGLICEAALENPTRLGRSRYECPICRRDISLAVVLVAPAELQDYSDDS